MTIGTNTNNRKDKNVLIALPSPRDIPEIKAAMDRITEYDKLWIKYSPEYISYPIMREQFLNHPSQHYTHLVICPDDLLIDDKSKLQLLLDDYDNCLLPEERDKTIICGYCNVDHGANSKYANITKHDVAPVRKDRGYSWIWLDELEHIRQVQDHFDHHKDYIKRYLVSVRFAGFPLIVIPRKAIEQIPFRNDSYTGKFDEFGCCVDVMFCHDAIKKGFQIYADTRVRLNHLKISDVETGKLLHQSAVAAAYEKRGFYHYYEYSKEIKVVS
ncbi:MAG: hypothetical protein ACM3X1_04480 [Ignavibacteriales bacterium]